jgi:osmotically-inducible protein OsmY
MRITYLIMAILSITLLSGAVMADSMWSPVTDTLNTGIINAKMMADHSLDSAKVDATVNHGVVAFSGEVDSKAQLDELASIALSVSGVKGVDVSKVKIRSHQ